MKITDPEIKAMLTNGRFKPIIKMVGERRMLIGFERKSRRSRKYAEKFMCSPQDLDLIVRQHENAKRKQSEQSAGGDGSVPSEGTGEADPGEPAKQPDNLGAGEASGG